MRRISWLVFLGSSALFAQVPAVNVGLTVGPGNQVQLGSPVTLTATLTPRIVKLPPHRPAIVKDRVRYTFTAQQTWPCQESVAILENSTNETVTWTAPKAGKYTFTVKVKYVTSHLPQATPTLKSAADLGSASRSNYLVKLPIGFSHNWVSSFSPPSGAAPLQVTLSGNLTNPPPVPHRLIFTFNCASCSPRDYVQDSQSMSASWTTNVQTKGQNTFWIYFDKVQLSPCKWVQTGYDHDFFNAN